DRAADRGARDRHPGRPAPSRAGLPLLPRDPPARQALRRRAARGGLCPGAHRRRPLLPACRGDPQARARSPDPRHAAGRGPCRAQTPTPALAAVPSDEGLGLLVETEWLAPENRRLATALREAKLRLSQACVEDIDYAARRELERALVRQLATCRWVHDHHNILISGMTGTGKSDLACALAQQACRKGYRALYRRAPRLYEELTLAHADGSYIRLLARFARIDVLVLD